MWKVDILEKTNVSNLLQNQSAVQNYLNEGWIEKESNCSEIYA